MTHPLRVAENCTTHPLHKAQNLMTHPLSRECFNLIAKAPYWNSRREKEIRRVKGSGEGAGREKRKRGIFFLPSSFPLSFFRPCTYPKGYYFYSPQSSSVIKSKMVATTIQTWTRFGPPKIRLYCRLPFMRLKTSSWLFKRWIALSTGQKSIQCITQLVSLILFRWIVIYPVDRAIQRLHNRGQTYVV